MMSMHFGAFAFLLGVPIMAWAAGAVPTTISLRSSAITSVLGRPVTLTATVAPLAARGSVTFYDGTTVLGTRRLVNGQAAFATGLLSAGVHSLKAAYVGDAVHTLVTQTVTAVASNGPLLPVSYAVNVNPSSVAVADFNGDGVVDIAVTSLYGTVSVLLGHGDGTLQAATTYPVSQQPASIASSDLNGDGVADLVTANLDGSISVLLGNRDGTFQNAVNHPIGGSFASIAAGDFNADGKADVACVGTSGDLEVLLGNGDGTFQPAVSYNAGLFPDAVAVGDFNGDGRADLAVAGSGVLLGNGDGTFGNLLPFNGGGLGFSIAVADLNKDGIPDLAAASYGFLEVALGNGDGTFQPAVTYVAGDSTGVTGFIPPAIAIGDLNGDGNPDLIVGDGGTNEWISVLYGNGSGMFGGAINYPSGNAPFALGVADFNGDGRTDVVVTGGISADAAGSVGVLLGSTPGPACSTVNPLSVAAGGNGGPQVLNVTEISPSCQWVVSSPNTWFELAVTGDPGNGTVAVLIQPDDSGVDQTGSFTVGGQTIPVIQRFTNQVFSDVPPAAYYFDAVNELSMHGITSGCAVGDFCPLDDVTRDEMAVFVVRTVFDGNDNFTYPAEPYFTDVPASYWAFKWIQKLFELGITTGCGPSLYCPTEPVTRDDMAIFLIRARYGATFPFDFSPVPFFTDVPATYFAFPWIQRLRMDLITNGCDPALYCPTSEVTRGDMAIEIMRAGFNQILPAGTPLIQSMYPQTIAAGTSSVYSISGYGTHFVQGVTTIAPMPGVTAGAITVQGTSLIVQLTAAADAPLNPISIVATTGNPPGNEEVVLPNGLAVVATSPLPTIASFSYAPAPGGPPDTYNFTFTGTNYTPSAYVLFCLDAQLPGCFQSGALVINSTMSMTLNGAALPPLVNGAYQLLIANSAGQTALTAPFNP